MEENHAWGIKQWSEEDRPREKLVRKGASVLSDAELIAILLGSGTRSESAVGVAQRILQKADNNLNRLARFSPIELSKSIRGVGMVKAVTIVAAMELARRKKRALMGEVEFIRDSSDVARIFLPELEDLPYEEFWMLLLNQSNKVLAKLKLSSGGVHQTIVDLKLLFKYALDHWATGIVLCHNHPSGNVNPSDADKTLTAKIIDGAKYFDIRVLDHVVVGGGTYFSFMDENII